MVLIQCSEVWVSFEAWVSNGEQEQLLMPRTKLSPFLTIFGTTMHAQHALE
jgi:hypothetical protein